VPEIPAAPRRAERPDPPDEVAAVRAMAEHDPMPDADLTAEGGSLFKRMSAALQRAMLGQPKDDAPES
jgi:hypothetical protein